MDKIQSVSSISKYNECPALYNLHYNYNVRPESKNQPSMDRGTCVHAGMEAYLRAYASSYVDRFNEAIEAARVCDRDDTITDDVRSEAIEILRYYLPQMYELQPFINKDKPLVEFQFEARFKGYGVSLQGLIDAVVVLPDGRLALVDWKVRGDTKNFYRPLPLQMDNQIPVYAAILKHVYGVEVHAAYQVQMNATLPLSPVLYKDRDPSFAESYYLKGRTTAARIAEIGLSEDQQSLLFMKFFDKIVPDTDYLAWSEVDLTTMDRHLDYTLRTAKGIIADTDFLPIMNAYKCQYCPAIVACRKHYFTGEAI